MPVVVPRLVAVVGTPSRGARHQQRVRHPTVATSSRRLAPAVSSAQPTTRSWGTVRRSERPPVGGGASAPP